MVRFPPASLLCSDLQQITSSQRKACLAGQRGELSDATVTCPELLHWRGAPGSCVNPLAVPRRDRHPSQPGSWWGSALCSSMNEETQSLRTQLLPFSFPPLVFFFFSLPVSISDIICPGRVTHSHSPSSSSVSHSARPRHFKAYTKHTCPFQFRRSHESRNGNRVILLEIIIITDRKRVVLVALQR